MAVWHAPFFGRADIYTNVEKNEQLHFKEDHGWVIAAVYDAIKATTFLVILDAEDVSSGPICTIDIKRQLPYGFHGSWKMPLQAIDRNQLQRQGRRYKL